MTISTNAGPELQPSAKRGPKPKPIELTVWDNPARYWVATGMHWVGRANRYFEMYPDRRFLVVRLTRNQLLNMSGCGALIGVAGFPRSDSGRSVITIAGGEKLFDVIYVREWAAPRLRRDPDRPNRLILMPTPGALAVPGLLGICPLTGDADAIQAACAAVYEAWSRDTPRVQ